MVGAALLALGPLVLPRWDARRMHTGLSRSPGLLVTFWRDGTFERALANLDVSEMRDGVDATVSIAGLGDQLSLLG